MSSFFKIYYNIKILVDRIGRGKVEVVLTEAVNSNDAGQIYPLIGKSTAAIAF